jgi:hypothetical protein
VDANDLTGARLMTFFLYLSDVDEGGETDFPSLNITVFDVIYFLKQPHSIFFRFFSLSAIAH